MRAVVAADFCNGTSAVLDFREWTFINADLTVNLRGNPSVRGSCSWIWVGPDGAGIGGPACGRARLFRSRSQSLVIEAMNPISVRRRCVYPTIRSPGPEPPSAPSSTLPTVIGNAVTGNPRPA
jgi:hypothetical protein